MEITSFIDALVDRLRVFISLGLADVVGTALEGSPREEAIASRFSILNAAKDGGPELLDPTPLLNTGSNGRVVSQASDPAQGERSDYLGASPDKPCTSPGKKSAPEGLNGSRSPGTKNGATDAASAPRSLDCSNGRDPGGAEHFILSTRMVRTVEGLDGDGSVIFGAQLRLSPDFAFKRWDVIIVTIAGDNFSIADIRLLDLNSTAAIANHVDPLAPRAWSNSLDRVAQLDRIISIDFPRQENAASNQVANDFLKPFGFLFIDIGTKGSSLESRAADIGRLADVINDGLHPLLSPGVLGFGALTLILLRRAILSIGRAISTLATDSPPVVV